MDFMLDAQAIVDTVRDALLILDGRLHVVQANRSFYRIFQVAPPETEGRVLYDLGNGAWDIPQLRVLLGEILPKQQEFLDYEVTHDFPKIGRKVMRLNARQIQTRDGQPETILLAIEDITERKLTEEALEETRRRLEEANRTLQRLSATDGLTGIANRRHLDERLEQEWRRAMRDALPVAFVMADVDDFKAFNDRYGHQDGDDCLIRVAEAVATHAGRPAELAARYGGEEFALLLPGVDLQAAKNLAERLRDAVETLGIPHASSRAGSRVTLSLGVACLIPGRGSSPSALIAEADRALFAAKAGGRNRVVAA